MELQLLCLSSSVRKNLAPDEVSRPQNSRHAGRRHPALGQDAEHQGVDHLTDTRTKLSRSIADHCAKGVGDDRNPIRPRQLVFEQQRLEQRPREKHAIQSAAWRLVTIPNHGMTILAARVVAQHVGRDPQNNGTGSTRRHGSSHIHRTRARGALFRRPPRQCPAALHSGRPSLKRRTSYPRDRRSRTASQGEDAVWTAAIRDHPGALRQFGEPVL